MAGSISPSYIEEYTGKGSPAIPFSVTDENGPVDLTGAVIKGYVLNLTNGSVIQIHGAFTIPDQATNNGQYKGQFTYQMTLIDVSEPGTWQLYISAKLPSESYTREFNPALFIVLPTPEWIANMVPTEMDLNVNGQPNSSTNPVFVQLVAAIVAHVIVDQLPALVLAASSANIGRVTPQVAGSDVAGSNPFPVVPSGVVGTVMPFVSSTPPTNTNAGAETIIQWGPDASHLQTINYILFDNESGGDVRFDFDTTATANSPKLKDGLNLLIARNCQKMHIYTASAVPWNTAGGVIARGYN